MNGWLIPVRDISPREDQAWRDLAAAAIEPNPLYEPECVVPAARHQTFGGEIYLAVAEDGGRFYACVPVRRVNRFHKFPYPIVTSQVRRMIYQGTPLVDGERGVEAMSAVLTVLAEERRVARSRVFALQEFTEHGPVAGFVRAAASELGLPIYAFESFERGVLRRREPPTYDDILTTRARRELRRRRRRLAEELGGEPVVVDRAGDPDAIDDYIALEASGYKTDIGVAMTTVAGEPEYFRDMCDRFAAVGRLHLVSLEVGGRTVAMNVWIRGGEGLFMIKCSFDEKYARFAVGAQLHQAAAEHFHDRTDAAWVDTCASPEGELLLTFYPDRRQFASFFIVLGNNWVDRAAMQSFMALRPLHKRYYDRRHPDASSPRGRARDGEGGTAGANARP